MEFGHKGVITTCMYTMCQKLSHQMCVRYGGIFNDQLTAEKARKRIFKKWSIFGPGRLDPEGGSQNPTLVVLFLFFLLLESVL